MKRKDDNTYTNATKYVKTQFEKSPFTRYIINKGNEFETNVIQQLKDKGHPVVSVSNVITPETVEKTKELMRLHVPIIHSAPVVNEVNKTRGIVDLLVRSDYVNHIVKKVPPIDQAEKPFYIVIDVKFTTLELSANNVNILNSRKFRAYKFQVLVYTLAIGQIQGFTSRYAYLLGRRINHRGTTSLDCFSQLGVIDFKGFDENIELFYDNPLVPINDISEIWSCGVKQQAIAVGKGVTSWRDPRFCAQLIEEHATKGKVIDAILNVNRSTEAVVLPDAVSTNLYDWKTTTSEAFVDFEIFCDVCHLFEYTNNIFMIGVWYEGSYYCFSANSISLDEEKRIMLEFMKFLEEKKITKLWYWYADKGMWNRRLRTGVVETDYMSSVAWYDMHVIFKSEPIVIKGCFKFGLKEIATALYNHKLITTKLDGTCTNGLDAGLKCYLELAKPVNEQSSELMTAVKKYNQFDVEVLSDVMRFLREKYIKN